ncbi:uncharacterized protein EI90DRAFT_418906 [Cantharellus anzutake]|uniref:uncharacterized protein n=1 Tax=Cantharellus anzutake TaxID=1750568 RepID=UPI001904C004|nr:uncharacterized protein EI90DRAFT_418906 [Cantharellus anzutake]KAF8314610.1 hypothetical protein EI90DRAFT_418906 [Cantharellus anzutake]
MGMSSRENLFGGFLSGLVLQTILFGVITVQAFLYYRRFPTDHISLKFAVGFLWLVQTFQVITSTVSVRMTFIHHFGVQSSTTVWYDTVYQISMVICSTIVQIYFVFRLYRLVSGSIWLPALLALLIPAQVGTGFTIWVKANITHGIESFVRPTRHLMISWLTLEAVADLMIAFAMSYFLHRRRTGFRQTDTVLRQLIVYAINTGLLTSVLALAVMFAFAFYGFHFVHMMFVLPLGGVYTASLLANLHSRSRLRAELHSGKNGISIHLSHLPPKIHNQISAMA